MSNSESKRDWKIIEYFVPIEIQEGLKDTDDFIIGGTAINETITRNNVKYTAEELNQSASGLADKPILKDHKNEVDAIVGRTTTSYFDSVSKSVKFEGKIMDKLMREMIKDGRIKNVSIGAKVKDLKKEEADGNQFVVAKGIEFLELSLVPVPGDAGATITQALSEAFNIKEEVECPECEMEFATKDLMKKHMDDKHPKDKTKEEKMENITVEQFNALKAELDAFKAEKIKAEETAKEAEKLKQVKEEIRKELVKELEVKTKGVVTSETVEDKGILESINGKYGYWEMPNYTKGGK